MNLDPRTLLFSLILIEVLMVLCLLVVARGQAGKRDGMAKWAAAIFLDALVWITGDAHGIFPDVITVVIAHGFKAASHAMMLAAICEFQHRRAPGWQYFVPVIVTLVTAYILLDDIHARFFWCSLIFIFQMLLIGRALLADQESRAGRAWWLLFGGVVIFTIVMGLRALVALMWHGEFAQVANGVAPQPVQIIAFVAVMAASLLGSIGFVLMEKERSDREIMLLAMTDSLTQVPNRRALMDRAEQLLARRNGASLALLMIDVDHFKRVNDRYGHPAGDEVLRQVAASFSERLRVQDTLGRYGGEEFCAVAPDTDMAGALRLAESLQASIAATSFAIDGLVVTISIGISICPENVTRALGDVLDEADAALYTAKQTGRNKVVCFGCENAGADKT